MARLRYLYRGVTGFVIVLAVLMAKATSSVGGTGNKQQEGDQRLITAVSKFDVLRNFKKGDTHSRLTDLKKFLATFGYLPHLGEHEKPPTALFDDSLETALRLYQSSFNLSVTGFLDRTTLDTLRIPRCGREDVRDGLPLMLLPKPETRLPNANDSRSPNSHDLDAQQWKFINGGRKMWLSTRNLTYAFSNFAESAILSSDDIRFAVASAFQSWAAVVPIDFQEIDDFEEANIKIEFLAGDHGDGSPFDGRLGVLSHAFAPEDGRFHLDSAEVWTVSVTVTDDKSAIDLETVALHEIGHLIGLDHSNVDGSVMFPRIETRNVKRRLTDDDIDGAMALYGSRPTVHERPLHHPHGPELRLKHGRYQQLSNSGYTGPHWISIQTVFLLAGFLFMIC